MVQITIEQCHDSRYLPDKLVGEFTDPVSAMPFISEFMQHFKFVKIELEPVSPDCEEVAEG